MALLLDKPSNDALGAGRAPADIEYGNIGRLLWDRVGGLDTKTDIIKDNITIMREDIAVIKDKSTALNEVKVQTLADVKALLGDVSVIKTKMEIAATLADERNRDRFTIKSGLAMIGASSVFSIVISHFLSIWK